MAGGGDLILNSSKLTVAKEEAAEARSDAEEAEAQAEARTPTSHACHAPPSDDVLAASPATPAPSTMASPALGVPPAASRWNPSGDGAVDSDSPDGGDGSPGPSPVPPCGLGSGLGTVIT